MAVNLENASLVLNTYDSTSISENTVNTWNNRTLLGSMYDKYETFNLCLSVVITDPTTIDIGNGIDGVKTRTNLIYIYLDYRLQINVIQFRKKEYRTKLY